MAVPTTLTWNLVGPTIIASGSQFNGGAKPKQHVMHTLRTLINSSSYWTAEVTDTTGSAMEALVLRPISTSDAQYMRIIATMNASGALGGSTTSLIMQDRTA